MLLAIFPLAVGTDGDDGVCLLQHPRQSSSFLRRSGVDARTRNADASSVEVVRVDAGRARAARTGGCTRGEPGDYLPCTSLVEPFDAACQEREAGLRLGPCEDAAWEVAIPAGTMTMTFEAGAGNTDEKIVIKSESASGWSTIATIESCAMETGPCTQVFDVQAGNLVIDSSSSTVDVNRHFLITSFMLAEPHSKP